MGCRISQEGKETARKMADTGFFLPLTGIGGDLHPACRKGPNYFSTTAFTSTRLGVTFVGSRLKPVNLRFASSSAILVDLPP